MAKKKRQGIYTNTQEGSFQKKRKSWKEFSSYRSVRSFFFFFRYFPFVIPCLCNCKSFFRSLSLDTHIFISIYMYISVNL